MARYRTIMDSMTATELDDPSVLSGSRIQRIAMGSGTLPEEVRELSKYYENMKRALKGVRGAGGKFNMQRMMKRFGGM
jgi:signal recognition particle subunit SRP54